MFKYIFKKLRRGALNRMNRMCDKHYGYENRPVFFDIKETCPQLLEADRKFEAIKKEFEHVAEQYAMPSYHQIDGGQTSISAKVAPEKRWKVFMIVLNGKTPEASKESCPETWAVVNQIPHVYQAFFSILEPGKAIPPHHAPFKGYLRYHLGLKIPAKNPPTIRVRDINYTWEAGKSMLFDDSWDHEVYNEAEEERAVLIIDIFRPLPWWQHKINSFFIKRVIKAVNSNQILKRIENKQWS